MSLYFSAANFVQRVLALGPEFSRYGAALDEKKTVDSTFLQNLTDQEIEILFAFIPQAHQVRLESLFPQNTNAALQDLPVEKPLPTLAYNSDDYDDTLPDKTFVEVLQVGSSSNVEDGGSGSGDGDLFLDLDKSDDELPTTAAKKRKKKNKRKKKKTATVPPPLEKSQEDLDTMAELDRWLSKGAPLSRKTALRTGLLIRAAKVGHMEAVKVLLGKPGIRVLLELPLMAPGNQMISALHMAAFHGNSGIVRLLLAKPGIQINRALVEGGFTPLFLASQKGHAEVVKILLDAGADKEVTDLYGCTSLHNASEKGHLEVVKVLLAARADIEAAVDGCTSLFMACQMAILRWSQFCSTPGPTQRQQHQTGSLHSTLPPKMVIPGWSNLCSARGLTKRLKHKKVPLRSISPPKMAILRWSKF